jgi:hypothetical protein
MSFLQIKSDNPKMSFIIKKNPSSGMSIVPLKEGKLFGWFHENSYNVFYKETKFNDESPELQFSSPSFVLNAINNFFLDTIKKRNEFDIEANNSIFINMTSFAQAKFINHFINFFKDYQFEIEDKVYCKRIKISTKKPLFDLLSLTAVMYSFFELKNGDTYVDSAIAIKYAKFLNNINAPYFTRYLYKSNIIKSENDFKSCKQVLDNNMYNFSFGDNYMSRVNFAKSHTKNMPVVDFGNGEARFAFFLKEAPHYIGYDKDILVFESALNNLAKIAKPHYKTFNNKDEFEKEVNTHQKVDVLLIEVIEHMDLEEAKKVIKEQVERKNLNKLIISTPNRDFNQHYNITGFRHYDHKYELDLAEFKELLKDYKASFFNIGDEINGISTSIGAVITL